MTIDQLNFAVKTADTGSINRAAKELYVSQPAVSGAIQKLEKELNIKIFVRTNKGIKTTSEGEEFLKFARIICGEVVKINELFCRG